MSRRWNFTDLEFVVLCTRYRGGELPNPFTFTSRIEYENPFEAEVGRIMRAFGSRFDPDLEDLADTISKPDVMVVLQAWDDRDFENPKERSRVLGIRRRARGFLITQRPGETLYHSDGFDVEECSPHALADAVVAHMAVLEAGREPPVPLPATAPPDTGDDDLFGSMVSDNEDPDLSDAFRAAAFFGTEASRSGLLQVLQGRSKFGPRGRTESVLLWWDMPADGRYVMHVSDAPVAVGMGSDALVSWVNEQVGDVMERLDRHREDEE
ncbi:ESX secretion-associated protein EspG [Nocardia sp. NPDC057353]|uniref:ESX secretion-associated protein EspG n=1 Tax=Nocardia sp. NPDC057353 TaxID=3346104 RepID=UPI00363C5DF7